MQVLLTEIQVLSLSMRSPTEILALSLSMRSPTEMQVLLRYWYYLYQWVPQLRYRCSQLRYRCFHYEWVLHWDIGAPNWDTGALFINEVPNWDAGAPHWDTGATFINEISNWDADVIIINEVSNWDADALDFELKKVLLPPIPPREFCRHILSWRKFQAASFKRCLHSVLRGVSLWQPVTYVTVTN